MLVTSYVFRDGELNSGRLAAIQTAVGREQLVLDQSCRLRDGSYQIVSNRWQRLTRLELTPQTLEELAGFCAEFLVELLGAASPIPVTYVGGVRSLEDLEWVRRLGQGRVDLSIGSALDIFGGTLPYAEVVAWQRHQERADGPG